MTYIVASLIFYIIGYIAGYFSQRDKIAQKIVSAKNEIVDILNRESVGVVKRPTQQDILKRTDPHERKLEEGKQAMRETLENIKELK